MQKLLRKQIPVTPAASSAWRTACVSSGYAPWKLAELLFCAVADAVTRGVTVERIVAAIAALVP